MDCTLKICNLRSVFPSPYDAQKDIFKSVAYTKGGKGAAAPSGKRLAPLLPPLRSAKNLREISDIL